MQTFNLLLLLILSFSFQVHADELYLHSALSISKSTSLWTMGDTKEDYSGTDTNGNATSGSRSYYLYSFDTTYSLQDLLIIEAGFGYGYVKLSDGDFLGAAAGESNSAFSEIYLGVSKEFYKINNHIFYSGLRYSHPGDSSISRPEFLSFNDFSQYLEFSLASQHFFNSFTLDNNIKYKLRTAGYGNNHLALESKLFSRVNNKIFLGTSIDYFMTFGGIDLGREEFNNYFIENDIYKVWDKDESWLGLALLGAYQFNAEYLIDFYVHRKLLGTNTDVSTTIAFGIGKAWDL